MGRLSLLNVERMLDPMGGNTIDCGGAELSVCHEIRRRRPAGSLVGISLFASGEEEP